MKNNELMKVIVTDEGVMIGINPDVEGAEIFSTLVKINLAIVTQYCKPDGKLNVFNAVSDLVKKALKDGDYIKEMRTMHSSKEESEKILNDFAKGGVFGDGKLH